MPTAHARFQELCTILDAPDTHYVNERQQPTPYSPQEKLYIQSRFILIPPQALLPEEIFCPCKELIEDLVGAIGTTQDEGELSQLMLQVTAVHSCDKCISDAVINQRQAFIAKQEAHKVLDPQVFVPCVPHGAPEEPVDQNPLARTIYNSSAQELLELLITCDITTRKQYANDISIRLWQLGQAKELPTQEGESIEEILRLDAMGAGSAG
jgi:hypothetical protein